MDCAKKKKTIRGHKTVCDLKLNIYFNNINVTVNFL